MGRLVSICVSLSLLLSSSAFAECRDELLLDGMTLCLATEQGDNSARRRVVEVLNGRNLLSPGQQLSLKEAFSRCVGEDAAQLKNFLECQALDPRIPLNMGRSLLGRPAVSARD